MGVAAIYQLQTPFTGDEIWDVGYEQANDVMVLTHLNHPPQRLARYGNSVWQIGDAIFGTQVAAPPTCEVVATEGQTTDAYPRNYSYRATAVDPNTGEESLPSPVASIGTNDLSLRGNFNTVTVGEVAGVTKYIVYKGYTDSFGFVGYTSSSRLFVDDNILPQFNDSFPGSANSNPFNGAGNYPGVVTFYEQRAIYGRTLNRPNAWYASQSSLFFNMNVSQPVQDSDAITVGLAARRSNAILHLVPMKDLLVFTTDAVWSVKGSNGYLTPASVNLTPQGYRGASKVRPVAIDQVVLFNTSRGATIRTINYQFNIDGYSGNDLTVFAPHFFERVKVIDMAWAEYPTQTVYCVMSDGKIRALTWQEEQQVWGWTLLETDGFFESVCVISEGGEDVPYFIVRREIGRTAPTTPREIRTIERGATTLWDDFTQAVYLDSAVSYQGASQQSFVNLDHLEGCQVVALVNGATVREDANHQPLTVLNGKLTLPHPSPEGSAVTIGLPYVSWVRTLPILPAGPTGSTRGKPQALGQMTMGVLRTRGLVAGIGKNAPRGTSEVNVTADMETDTVYPIKPRRLERPGTVPLPYTGDVDIDGPVGDWTSQSVIVIQRDPLPFHITSISPDVVISS